MRFVVRCTRTGTALNSTTRWRSTASSPSARLSVPWPTKSKTRFRAEPPPSPRWSPCFSFLTVHVPRRDASVSVLDPTECMETAEEQRVHSPPASLVPRLHVLHARRLSHNNPLLPAATVEDNSAGETILFRMTVGIYIFR